MNLILAALSLLLVARASSITEPKTGENSDKPVNSHVKLDFDGVYSFFQSFKALPIGSFPFENDQTGFYAEAFIYKLSIGDEETKTLLKNSKFLTKYKNRIIAAAIENGWEDVIKKNFDPEYVTLIDEFKAAKKMPSSSNLDKILLLACSNSNLDKVVEVFQSIPRPKPRNIDEGSPFDLEGDLLNYVFEFGEMKRFTILDLAVLNNNLILLRDCLGLDQYKNPSETAGPTADPNLFATNFSPLMLAIMLGNYHAAEILLKSPKTDVSKYNAYGINARTLAYNIDNESIRRPLLDLISNYSTKIATGEGSLALAILDGNDDEAIEAILWNLDEGEASDEAIAAAVVMNRIDILKRLLLEERVDFENMRPSTKAAVFEAMTLLNPDAQRKMIDFLAKKQFKFNLTGANSYYKGNLTDEYYASVMDLVFTEHVPPAMLNYVIEKKLFGSEEIHLLIFWAFGRRDVDLLKLITKHYPQQINNFKDPLTSEPTIHIVVRELYPITRDLDLVKLLCESGIDVSTEYDHLKERTLVLKKKFDFEKQFWSWGERQAFSVTHKCEVSVKPSSKTIAHYLFGNEDRDKELVDLLKQRLSEKDKAEIESFNSSIDSKFSQPERFRAYMSQLDSISVFTSTNEYFFRRYLFGLSTSSEAAHYRMKNSLEIDANYSIGPEGYSVYHVLASPRQVMPFSIVKNHVIEFKARNFNLNHPAIVGEKVKGYDNSGNESEKICKDWTAVMISVFRRNWESAELLMKSGADVFITTPDGYNCAPALLEGLHQKYRQKSK